MDIDLFNPSKQIRTLILFRLSVLLALVSLLLALFSFSYGNYFSASVDLLFCLFSLWVYARIKHSRYSFVMANLYTHAIITLVIVGTLTTPLSDGLFVWSCLFPVMFYLVLGKTFGFVSTAMALVVESITIVYKLNHSEVFEETLFLINLYLCFFCIWATVHILEVKRHNSENSLGELAARDALTGVYNRHALIHNFQTFRQQQNQQPLALLILDIDFFKSVNDRFGHPIGDKVLVQTASLIDGLSGDNMVYRIGGEEFCVALTNTGMAKAKQKAEHLRSAIEAYEFNDKNLPIKLTASIGVYQCDRLISLEDVLKRADKELYRAKQNGRNQVMISGFEESPSIVSYS
ncbi:diguanylate cyclase (GGDEF) domain-containing protein [Vibrio xiamenensis]|uniref:diguanylate cyclase n=1 Tax=Vibrio xiamenensis TaxID=861298 RepID=A0A1G8E286_9VIBR|nr:GGDEF domain-containing protein [Vibrio xiamenensis]SDH64033.1 diguanylate cyclase (GGDEF) domain-containing protein [Vibrio xiamenensis]